MFPASIIKQTDIISLNNSVFVVGMQRVYYEVGNKFSYII
jgi:hypothetical protein